MGVIKHQKNIMKNRNTTLIFSCLILCTLAQNTTQKLRDPCNQNCAKCHDSESRCVSCHDGYILIFETFCYDQDLPEAIKYRYLFSFYFIFGVVCMMSGAKRSVATSRSF